ncbi:MAG: cystathionine beta-synthase [Ignavibacteria bacterium]|nr:cystathionine beta-synthase [Ignavibacteria bacterium]
MKFKQSILEQIGNTPLIRLNKINKGLKPKIFAKLESANPGGSVKDRIGIAMIEDAERKGLLKPGGTIIEATSGNTGIGLALAAAVKGYKCIFVVTDKVSNEKVNYLRAFGAEVIIVPRLLPPDDPDYYVNVAKRLSKEIPNSFFAYQYSNSANPEIHYRTTGPEIWNQTEGKITHFVSGIGTGGTITGVGKFLKEKNPQVKVIGADPFGSIYKHYKETGEITKGAPYLVEGIGQDCLPEILDFNVIDEIINVSDRDSFLYARRLTQEEGIFAGGSTGTNLYVALKIAQNLTENDVIVFIVCDTGERYLSKFYNNDWLREHRILIDTPKTLKDLVDIKKSRGYQILVSLKPDDKVEQAIELISSSGFSNIPVIENRKSIGVIRENRLLMKLIENPELKKSNVKDVMDESLLVLDSQTQLDKVKEHLKKDYAVLVSEFGRIVDIITRYDLIEFN